MQRLVAAGVPTAVPFVETTLSAVTGRLSLRRGRRSSVRSGSGHQRLARASLTAKPFALGLDDRPALLLGMDSMSLTTTGSGSISPTAASSSIYDGANRANRPAFRAQQCGARELTKRSVRGAARGAVARHGGAMPPAPAPTTCRPDLSPACRTGAVLAAARALIVADLHLEKGELVCRARPANTCAYDSRDTLAG